MMFEDLDKFIAENPGEVLVTGGWTDDKISELEKQLSIVFREEVKIFIRKYGVLIGYGAENYMKQATHQSVRFYHCRR